MALIARLEPLLRRQLELANPMLVRRVRQDLRNMAFIGAFLLMLVVATGAAVIFASMADGGDTTGRGMFAAVAAAWTALMCLQGVATQRAIAGDRSAAAWDLLELTGLPPIRIVIGVVQANLVLGLLGAAGLAPFLVLAYLLRGIDLPTILFALLSLPMLGAAVGALGALAGCLGANRQSRAGLGGLTGLGLLVAWILLTIFWARSDDMISPWMAAILAGEPGAALALLGLINGWLAFLALTFTCAAAMLTHRALDRSTWPRLVWFAIWGNGLVWCGGVFAWIAFREGADEAARAANHILPEAASIAVTAALTMGFFAITEDLEITPRQQRSLSEGGRVMRTVRHLIGPGAARGARATILMLIPSLLLAVPVIDRAAQVIDLAAYGVVMLALGDIIARRIMPGFCSTPPARRMCMMAVQVVLGVVPPIAAQACPSGISEWVLALSPTAILFHDREALEATRPVVMLAGLIAFAWMLLRAMGRTRGLARVTARDDDANPRR